MLQETQNVADGKVHLWKPHCSLLMILFRSVSIMPLFTALQQIVKSIQPQAIVSAINFTHRNN